jgi:REP element-mobilizing transposase RayT
MKYNPDIHHLRSIRLPVYDYTSSGAYFITICTHNRQNLFGEIVDGEMILNEYGEIVRDEWLNTGNIRSNIIIDEFVVMPNHVHGILIIGDNRWGVWPYAPTNNGQIQSFKSPSKTIGSIVCGFKSTITKKINQIRNTPTNPIWQRNYYEHIIRNDDELNHIREYIINNPLQWELDENIIIVMNDSQKNFAPQCVKPDKKRSMNTKLLNPYHPYKHLHILNVNYNMEIKIRYIKRKL